MDLEELSAMNSLELRSINSTDRAEVAELNYLSTNTWYRTHGWPPVFALGSNAADVFFDVYGMLDPDCGVVAVNPSAVAGEEHQRAGLLRASLDNCTDRVQKSPSLHMSNQSVPQRNHGRCQSTITRTAFLAIRPPALSTDF
jgi:hypothetical protein